MEGLLPLAETIAGIGEELVAALKAGNKVMTAGENPLYETFKGWL